MEAPATSALMPLYRITATALLLLIVPVLFLSSETWVGWVRLAALLLMLPYARRVFPAGLPPRLKQMAVLLVLAFGFSWLGGRLSHQPLLMDSLLTAGGLLSVAGYAVLLRTLSLTGWDRKVVQWLVRILAVLLVCSLIAYFLPIQRLIPMGDNLQYFDATRLALIWPTRLLMTWASQLGWGHANHAGLLFGIAFILALEHLHRKKHDKKITWMVFAIGLGAALFLTGSRGALLMLIPCLPLVLIGRKLGWILRCIILCTVAFGCGLLALKAKEQVILSELRNQTSAPVAPTPPPDNHLAGLIHRGSAGRMGAYQSLLETLKGSLVCGRGLTENTKPMSHLINEHSSYLATFRGGGFAALIAHSAVLLLSAFVAVQLFRQGTRWPLLLLGAVTVNLLFDRGSIFLPNGSYEFLFHWTAVLCPLLMGRETKTEILDVGY